MNSMEAAFDSRAALREALLDTFAEGGIFVEGNYEVTSGSPVTVRVAVGDLAVGVFLEGLVQWRRVGPAVRSAGIAPGVGIRMLASEQERFQFLTKVANEQAEGSGRAEWRYPTELKAFLSPSGRSTGRIVHAVLRDVSPHGGLVSVPTKLAVAQIHSFEFQFEGEVHSVPARIVWSSDDRAGMAMVLDKPEDRATWSRLAGDAITRFEARRVSIRRTTGRASFRPPG
jgi:hypothetical protein